jgi:DNA topoisomerase-3
MGEVKDNSDAGILFRTTGKVIIEEGWKVVFPHKSSRGETPNPSLPTETEAKEADDTLPIFEEGESGPHTPTLSEKWTTPPKPYTDATLLRAMETAGKTVEDETLRDALKENGIGRPSTRAAIIETLIRRNYIKRERSSLRPTTTGFELIDLIHEDVLKSAELTGRWEKKLRQIERHEYDAKTFLDELKQMVSDIVLAVLKEKKPSL